VPNEQDVGPPQQLPNVPPDVSVAAGQARLLIKAVENAVEELKKDVREIKSHQRTDLVNNAKMFAAGFLILAGMLIYGYFRLDDRLTKMNEILDSRITTLNNIAIRVDTKLEDLLQRIPPVPTPPARR
jgi:hypothetical protein